ncbi:putative ribonuclease h protein [Fagus crenata]
MGDDVCITEVGNGLLQFKFSNNFQMQWVLDHGPWNFDNHLLLLRQWEVGMSNTNTSFSHATFWIQVWGIPFEMMTKEVGTEIGSRLGLFDSVDKRSWSSESSSNLRIRVAVPIVKPLRRGGYLLSPEGQRFWVHYRYERLLSFCHCCGLLAHTTTQCKVPVSHPLPYGDWMRAIVGGRTMPSREQETHKPSPAANGSEPTTSDDGAHGYMGVTLVGDPQSPLSVIPAPQKARTDTTPSIPEFSQFSNPIPAVQKSTINDCTSAQGVEMMAKEKEKCTELDSCKSMHDLRPLPPNPTMNLTSHYSTQMEDINAKTKALATWKCLNNKKEGMQIDRSQASDFLIGIKRPISGLEVTHSTGGLRHKRGKKSTTPQLNDDSIDLAGADVQPRQSDHVALLVEIGTLSSQNPRRKRLQKFEEKWATSEECEEVIRSAWDSSIQDPLQGSPMYRLVERIKLCRSKLAEWGKLFNGADRIKMEEYTKNLEALMESNEAGCHNEAIFHLKTEMNACLLREEIYWRQRSKALWLEAGDKNTKYFHQRASQRKRKNLIRGLFDSSGHWQETDSEVANIAEKYFTELFSTDHPSQIHHTIDAIEPMVSPDHNNTLLQPFTAIEGGVTWKVGNGNSINIWRDKWLPVSLNRPNMPTQVELVRDLLTTDRQQWNSPLIAELFEPYIAAMINNIALGDGTSRDRLLWNHTPKCTFTVASVYRQAIKTNVESDVAEHSRASTTYRFWRGLWKAQVPNKCKHMMWRACRNTLPTLSTLGGRGVPIDATCKICCQSRETLTHALWTCLLARNVWALGRRKWQKMAWDEDQDFFNLTLLVAQCSTNEELQEWFMISWAIWDARNRYVFDNTQLQPATILSTTLKYLEDFKKVAKLGAVSFLSAA